MHPNIFFFSVRDFLLEWHHATSVQACSMCFYFVKRSNICACSLLKLCRTCAILSGEFHLGPWDVVHDYVVFIDVRVLHSPVVLG